MCSLLSIGNCIWLKARELLTHPVYFSPAKDVLNTYVFLFSHTGAPKVGGVVLVWCPVPSETQAPSLFLPQQFEDMNSMLMVPLGSKMDAGVPTDLATFCRPEKVRNAEAQSNMASYFSLSRSKDPT